MPLSDVSLLQYLACPEDKGPLWYFESDEVLYNPRLHRSYAIKEGIPVLLIDEATSVTKAQHDQLMAKAKDQGITPNFEVDSNAGTPTA